VNDWAWQHRRALIVGAIILLSGALAAALNAGVLHARGAWGVAILIGMLCLCLVIGDRFLKFWMAITPGSRFGLILLVAGAIALGIGVLWR
jgi:hypothetical protein